MKKKLRAGDLVQVKTADEILATLDESGCLDRMPFMPEMLAHAGKQFRVSSRAHKTCDTVNQTGGRKLDDCVHLDDLRCDGSAHGGCDAWCLLFWKDAWLSPVENGAGAADTSPPDAPDDEATSESAAAVLAGTTQQPDVDGSPVYRCQATQLYEATEPLKWWNPGQYVEDLTSGNTTIPHMLRVWLFHGLQKLMGFGIGYRFWRAIYEKLQLKIGGHGYPYKSGTIPKGQSTPASDLHLQPGECVRIKSHDEIVATLNVAKQNRGMRFDEEMVPYCGKHYKVLRRVERIINEKTGKMTDMGTPSVIMDGVVCRSEFSNCRLFCPRAIPSYWREIWLERASHNNPRTN